MLRLVKVDKRLAPWRVLAEVRRQRQEQTQQEMLLLQQQPPSSFDRHKPPPRRPDEPLFTVPPQQQQQQQHAPPLQPLAPTAAALEVLKLLQSDPGLDLPTALSQSSFSPSPSPNLASLLDLLPTRLHHRPDLPLQTLAWSLRHPDFSPESPLLPPRISPLLPPPAPASIPQFLSDAHRFWLHPDLPLPPSLLDPLIALYSCAAASLQETLEVLNLSLSKGGDVQAHHFNQVLQSAVVQHGEIDTAEWLLGRMQAIGRTPNTASYNILVKAYCEGSNLQKASDMFQEMMSNNIVPNDVTYTTLIVGATNAGDLDRALEFLREMKYNGHRPTEDIYGAVMKAYAGKGDHKVVSSLVNEMGAQGLSLDDQTYDSLVAIISRSTGMPEAEARQTLGGGPMSYDSWNVGS